MVILPLTTVRLLILLLSGLFCCLGFSVAFFAVWARAWAPPKQQKTTRPHPNSKNINTPPPFRASLFLVVWAGGCVYFFCCLGGGRVFFAVWGWAFIFLLFGRWACFFLAVWAGGVFFFFFLLFGRGTGVHSLTGLPGSSKRDPTTQTTNQKTKRFPLSTAP